MWGSKRPEVAPASCPTSAWAPPQPQRPRTVDGRGAWGRQASLLLTARLFVPITEPALGVGFPEKVRALQKQERLGSPLLASAFPALCWVVGPPSKGLGPAVLSSPALCTVPCVGPSGAVATCSVPGCPEPNCRSCPPGSFGDLQREGLPGERPPPTHTSPASGLWHSLWPGSKSL